MLKDLIRQVPKSTPVTALEDDDRKISQTPDDNKIKEYGYLDNGSAYSDEKDTVSKSEEISKEVDSSGKTEESLASIAKQMLEMKKQGVKAYEHAVVSHSVRELLRVSGVKSKLPSLEDFGTNMSITKAIALSIEEIQSDIEVIRAKRRSDIVSYFSKSIATADAINNRANELENKIKTDRVKIEQYLLDTNFVPVGSVDISENLLFKLLYTPSETKDEVMDNYAIMSLLTRTKEHVKDPIGWFDFVTEKLQELKNGNTLDEEIYNKVIGDLKDKSNTMLPILHKELNYEEERDAFVVQTLPTGMYNATKTYDLWIRTMNEKNNNSGILNKARREEITNIYGIILDKLSVIKELKIRFDDVSKDLQETLALIMEQFEMHEMLNETSNTKVSVENRIWDTRYNISNLLTNILFYIRYELDLCLALNFYINMSITKDD